MKPQPRSKNKAVIARVSPKNINKKNKRKRNSSKKGLNKSIEHPKINALKNIKKDVVIKELKKRDDLFEDDEYGNESKLPSDDEDEVECNSEGIDQPSGDEGETDEEELIVDGKSNEVTLKHVKSWGKGLKDNRGVVPAFKKIEQALSAAIESISGDDSEKMKSSFIVQDTKVFNAVVSLCLTQVAPALQKVFALKCLSDRPAKNKKWKKMSIVIKNYLKKLVVLSQSITDPTAIQVLLKKGILPILPFYVEFATISWNLMKQMATLWCTSHEKVRVLALVVIFRLLRSMKVDFREKALKLLYMSYVKNCVFTSPTTWPMINFMRDSLVELYKMNEPLAYRQAFLYIRQLAFHLRNAMLIQKKERIQLVSNWRYIHCLHLWADLLSKSYSSNILQPLVYPLTQIAVGVIGLLKSPKNYPLIFHVCNILTGLSQESGLFIPVIPHLLEILSTNLRSKKTSENPLEWSCILKVSSSQVGESAFCDGIIDQIYDSLISYMNIYCSSIGFPELVFPAIIQIKTFLKKSKFANYTKKIKQLLMKVEENVKFINERRKEVTFNITDTKAIKNWEIATLQSNPPLRAYYCQWKKVKESNPKAEVPIEEENDSFSIAAVRKRQKTSLSTEDSLFDESFKEEEPEKKKKKKTEEDGGCIMNSKKETKAEIRINDIFGADVEQLMVDDDKYFVTEKKLSADDADDDEDEAEEDEDEAEEEEEDEDEAEEDEDEAEKDEDEAEEHADEAEEHADEAEEDEDDGAADEEEEADQNDDSNEDYDDEDNDSEDDEGVSEG